MNKKLIIIPFIALSSLVLAQESESPKEPVPQQQINPEMFKPLKIDYIKANTKTLHYEITIKEENHDVYKSSFEIQNGKEFMLINKEFGNQIQQFNKKIGLANQQPVITTLESVENQTGNLEQLKLTANIGKDRNIFSEFIFKSLNVENIKKISTLENSENASVLDVSPTINKNENKILVTHSKNSETFFTLDKKEFTIKAIY